MPASAATMSRLSGSQSCGFKSPFQTKVGKSCISSGVSKAFTAHPSWRCPETVFGNFVEYLSGRQFGGREIGMVGRVRIMLGLERDGAVRDITLVQRHFGAHRIAAIDLHARLGGPDFHHE